jgi:hypothetical protein
MAHLGFHPAAGLGDLMNGWFVVPQNPIRGYSTGLVASLQGTSPNRILRRPRLRELMQGGFTVPQNPIRTALSGVGASPLHPGIRMTRGGNSWRT